MADGRTGRSIFSDMARHGDRPCLISPQQTLTYRSAASAADALYATAPDAGLAFVLGHTTPAAILAYIGAVRRGYAVHLLDPAKPDANDRLIARYRPDVLVDTEADKVVRALGPGTGIHPKIAILLSTSGSTGTPKLVKLSRQNIAANTDAIISYLGLTAADTGITSLKPFYSYGLSVINTHLACGASIVVSDLGMDTPSFWTLVQRECVTNIAGVPFSFELMRRMEVDLGAFPSVRLLTQAGGKLAPDHVRHFADEAASNGVSFCVMYGQTEAAPRMSYLPPALAAKAPDSIGRAIPGGRLYLIDEAGARIAQPFVSGELVYEGPNVMVGYAETRGDLATIEDIGPLHTGDIAHMDAEGLFYIDGRTSRFVKPFGIRVSLDEVEALLRPDFPDVAVTGSDDRLVVSLGLDVTDKSAIVARLAGQLSLPKATFVIAQGAPAPRLASGKVDYQTLLQTHAPVPKTSSFPSLFLREFWAILSGKTRKPASVLEAYQMVLGPRVQDRTCTFQSAGGDSLRYMQTLLLLEECLNPVPENWAEMSVAELEDLRDNAFV